MSAPRDDAAAFCREILPRVSRTFALSIRLLPGTLGEAVAIAYLLCRIADTVEDEPTMSPESKAALLDALRPCLSDAGAVPHFVDAVQHITGDAAHVRLTTNADRVFARYFALPAATRAALERWVGEMIAGMRKFVLVYPHGIRIQTLDEYREYCYYVAGTVGFMLTELWREHTRSIDRERFERLWARSREFGEALQTVNILKDVTTDAERENSIYLPEELLREHGGSHATLLSPERVPATRAAMDELVRLARADLDAARDYLLLIPRRAVSIRLFCVLPLLFAYATLRDLTRTPSALVRREVVKISRAEVKALTVLGFASILSNRALRWLARRASARPVTLWGAGA